MSDFHKRKQIVRDLLGEIKAIDLTPYDYWRDYLKEAVYCYNKQRNIACILTSSATVETLLFWEYLRRNKESVTLKLIKSGKGAVSFRTLAKIEEIGSLAKLFDKLRNTEIPLKLLLDNNELESFKKMANMESKARMKAINNLNFISVRNKFAHGSIFEVVGQMIFKRFLKTGLTFEALGFTGAELEEIAYRQLSKCLLFMRGFSAK